jgi:hypothetical protein
MYKISTWSYGTSLRASTQIETIVVWNDRLVRPEDAQLMAPSMLSLEIVPGSFNLQISYSPVPAKCRSTPSLRALA